MLARTLIGSAALLLSSTAFAATQTWNFVNGSGSGIENNDAHGIGSGTYIDMTVGGIEVVVSAWSSTGEGACAATDPGCNTYDSDPYIARAQLTKYSGGLGAINQDESNDNPNHSFDNVLGQSPSADFDMMLLQFDEAVMLEEIDINWRGSDSDMTVLSYTGNDAINGVPFNSSTDTWTSLLNDGWSFVDNYSNVSTSNNQIVSASSESRYWLVGVYNPIFGDGWTNSNDAVKIAGITTSTTPPSTDIPEPAMLLLFTTGLLALRRRH